MQMKDRTEIESHQSENISLQKVFISISKGHSSSPMSSVVVSFCKLYFAGEKRFLACLSLVVSIEFSNVLQKIVGIPL